MYNSVDDPYRNWRNKNAEKGDLGRIVTVVEGKNVFC